MGEARRQTPRGMPGEQRVQAVANKLKAKFLLTGSRDDRPRRNPGFEILSNYRIRGGELSELEDRNVVIFVHGYNVTGIEGLAQNEEYFSNLGLSLEADGHDLEKIAFVGFTWPGDVGPVYFNDAQQFAHHSGTSLFRLTIELLQDVQVRTITLVTHSLGAHVGLRAASILGERLIHTESRARYDSMMMLAPAVEDDVFERPDRREEYHFPESAFGMERLHIFVSRDDGVLRTAFFASEFDKALGLAGPESMSPLQSLSRRVATVTESQGNPESFQFELHDFSTSSAMIMNPDLWARSHSDYWQRLAQTNFYANFVAIL